MDNWFTFTKVRHAVWFNIIHKDRYASFEVKVWRVMYRGLTTGEQNQSSINSTDKYKSNYFMLD